MATIELPEGCSLFIYQCVWRKKTKHGMKLKASCGNLAAPSLEAATEGVKQAVGKPKKKRKIISMIVRPVDLQGMQAILLKSEACTIG